MSEPGVGPTFGISSGDVLIVPERHPACRRREARPGSCMERENLAGDVKAKGTSGSNREAESTDAPERGGPPEAGGGLAWSSEPCWLLGGITVALCLNASCASGWRHEGT